MVTRVDVDDESSWLLERRVPLRAGRVHRVDELLPAGYDAYLRLFHPFVAWHADPGGSTRADERRTWASLASEAGVQFHGELMWRSLEGVLPITNDARPYAVWWEGEIEAGARSHLFALLSHATPGLSFFFFGLAAVILGGKPMLYSARTSAIEDVCARAEREAGKHVAGPELAWPETRSWVVATDYDLLSTYIAAHHDLAAQLTSDNELETLPVTLETRIDNGADLVNGTGFAVEKETG